MKYAMVAMFLLAGVAMTTTAQDAEKPNLEPFPEVTIKEGNEWPGFYLPDLEGNPLSVQDYRGKKIVLHIFASW